MGKLPAKSNMISAIITSPQAGQTIQAGTDFNIVVQTSHLTAGKFTNPTTNYYTAPQDLDNNGDIIGHCHVTVQDIGSMTSTTPPDPSKFVFFKGIDDAGDGKGLLQAAVPGGLPAGVYRVCTMIAAANHQPVAMPVAQRGAQDDCTKFEVTADGGGGNGGGGANAGNGKADGGNGDAAASSTSSTQTDGAQATAKPARGGQRAGGQRGGGNTQASASLAATSSTGADGAQATTKPARGQRGGQRGGGNAQASTLLAATSSTSANEAQATAKPPRGQRGGQRAGGQRAGGERAGGDAQNQGAVAGASTSIAQANGAQATADPTGGRRAGGRGRDQ